MTKKIMSLSSAPGSWNMNLSLLVRRGHARVPQGRTSSVTYIAIFPTLWIKPGTMAASISI
jgi:hypothetical protein